jgi:hypothetical protein
MNELGDLVAGVSAAVIMYAALVKIANPGSIAATIDALWPFHVRPPAMVAGRVLGAAELSAAFLIAVGPRPMGALLLWVLGFLFAVAGLVAIRRGVDMPCNCLGPLSKTKRLGASQLRALPMWLSAGFVLYVTEPAISPTAAAALVVVAVSTTVMIQLIGALLDLRSTRILAAGRALP